MGRWIPKGEWTYDNQTRQVRSTKAYKCVSTNTKRLFLENCEDAMKAQQWKWTETYIP